jgi:hypothetical protein
MRRSAKGCHTANVRSWDNSDFSGYQTYGNMMSSSK